MRSVLLLAHTARPESRRLIAEVIVRLAAADFEVRMLAGEAEQSEISAPALPAVPGAVPRHAMRLTAERDAVDGAELVLVLGGDGTFLRAAELARPARVPMLGINLGHVGFLAECEPSAIDATVDAIVARSYTVEERVTVQAEVSLDGESRGHAWALNEASLERTNRARMLDLAVAVDGRPLLRFGCDGVLCATPTGSTAYAYSVGGPVVWPDVDALLLVPNAAHALFARPLVIAPSAVIDIDLRRDGHAAMLSCDGRRLLDVPSGSRVQITRGSPPVYIARMPHWSFADRLVTKFGLPVRTLREAAYDGDEASVRGPSGQA